MQLIQNGYECEFDLNIFIKMFFAKDDDAVITTDFVRENETLTVNTLIEYQNNRYSAKCTYTIPENISAQEQKKLYTTTCAKSFCRAAKQIKDVPLPWGVMSGIRPAKNIRALTKSGMSAEQVREYVKNVYEVTDDKLNLAFEVAENEEKILAGNDKNAVSLYIGIPFCPTRCLYCSFVSTDMRVSGKYMDEFVRLLCVEIEKTAEVMEKIGVYAECIYIGGGTPTSLSAEQIKKITDCINKNIDLSRLREFTFEAGRADTITEEKLKAAFSGGADRISINPQTMHDVTLKKVGRTHTADDVRNAFSLARKVGFKNINMDLIAGLPDETADMFAQSLDEVIKLDPENITVHTMCIKRAARLDIASNDAVHANQVSKMLSYTQKRMRQTGRAPYYMYRQKNILGNLENVGYAKDGCMGIYNVKIMEEVQTIIALGGGGATKVVTGDRIERIFNFKDPSEYIKRFNEIIERKEMIASGFQKG